MKRLESLQIRLLLLMGTVLMVTLLTVAGTVYGLVANAEREVWQGRQVETGRNASMLAENYLRQALLSLRFLSQGDQDISLLPELVQTALENVPGILEIIVVDAHGRVLYSSAVDEVVLANVFTITQANWFQSVLQGTEQASFVGNVQISPRNELYILLSMKTSTGGVVALRLSLGDLGEIVFDAQYGETGTTYVVQKEGFIVAHPDPDVVQRSVSLAGRSELRALTDGAASAWTDNYVNFRGVPVIGTVSEIADTNLLVITEVEEAEAISSSRNALIVLGAVTVIFWLGAMLVASSLVRRLVFVPIELLQGGARQVAEGNLSYQVKIMRHDEIGKLSESFNQMARSLEARANERERLVKDLQVAKRLAEENSRLKSEFLSTMSHELRTPMNAIEGFTSIMLSRMGGAEFNDKTERYITRVNANSKRLLQLINDFLDLSRVESGRLELASQPFSPLELAQRWKTEIGILAEKKGIELELTLDPNLPEVVYGDEEAVSKVALNLLSNAIKFTEQGKVTLTVANGGDQWRIVVADTGIGIPPHAREFVFEEFRQVDQTSKRKYGGTGLGLAIVQKYTRTMGGTVALQSEVGEGSTFTVTLPLQPKDGLMPEKVK